MGVSSPKFLGGVAAWTYYRLLPSPIPAIAPYVVRTHHIHGTRATDDTTPYLAEHNAFDTQKQPQTIRTATKKYVSASQSGRLRLRDVRIWAWMSSREDGDHEYRVEGDAANAIRFLNDFGFVFMELL